MDPTEVREYCIVEYPGNVNDAKRALENLGGLPSLAKGFFQAGGEVELRFKSRDPFRRPVYGNIVSSNRLLMRLVVRKTMKSSEFEERHVHSANILGIVAKTCRFRGIADYQCSVNESDPMYKLKIAMNSFDVAEIERYKHTCSYYRENTFVLMPPPVFSRTDYPVFVRTEKRSDEELSEVDESQTQFINRNKTRHYSVSLSDPSSEVPENPPFSRMLNPDSLESQTLAVLRDLFEERPIWLRKVIENRVPDNLRFAIGKCIVLVAYSVYTGPWRSCWVRYGYDPRKIHSSCIYQLVKTFKHKEKVFDQEKDGPILRRKKRTGLYVTSQIVDVLDRKSCERLIDECVENEYSHDRGWLTVAQLARLRDAVVNKVITSPSLSGKRSCPALCSSTSHTYDLPVDTSSVFASPPEVGNAFSEEMRKRVQTQIDEVMKSAFSQ